MKIFIRVPYPTPWSGEIVWITPTDITSNGSKYISDSEDKVTEEGLDNCSADLLEPGAVLMTSRATIGEVSINSVPACTNQGFKSFVCGDDLNNEYLYYYISFKKKYLNRLGGGSTFSEISKKDTENIDIPLPNLKEQEEIISVLSSVDKKLGVERNYKQRLERLKKGLMQDLLSGEKRV